MRSENSSEIFSKPLWNTKPADQSCAKPLQLSQSPEGDSRTRSGEPRLARRTHASALPSLASSPVAAFGNPTGMVKLVTPRISAASFVCTFTNFHRILKKLYELAHR